MKNLRYLALFFLVLLFITGCKKEENPTNSDTTEYPGEPSISKIYPSVAIANGYIYIQGTNFGKTSASITVNFKSRKTGEKKAGTIESVVSTLITVKVPGTIDTASVGNDIEVTTPKGTTINTTTTVYGILTSAFGDSLLPGKGLIGKVYQLAANTPKLPNFDTMQVKSVLLAPNLNVTDRAFTQGFPGVPGGLVEWFGIRFEGKIDITTAGNYIFYTGSDDGSKLYINDSLVVNNDGTHGYAEVSAVKTLAVGKYKLRVDYFQGPRYNIAMRLFWTKPGGTKEIVPASVILLPDTF